MMPCILIQHPRERAKQRERVKEKLMMMMMPAFNGLLHDTNRDFCFVGPRKSEKPTSRVSCIIEVILLTSCGSKLQFYPGDKKALWIKKN